jgi:hypothetical protein
MFSLNAIFLSLAAMTLAQDAAVIEITSAQGAGQCARNAPQIAGDKVILGPLPSVIAKVGGDGSRNSRCQLLIQLKYPAGVQVRPVIEGVSGTSNYGDGVTGGMIYSHFFSSHGADSVSVIILEKRRRFANCRQHGFSQSLPNGAWNVASDSFENETVWSGCGGSDTVSPNFRVSLSPNRNNAASSGTIQLTNTAPITIGFVSRPCAA